MSKQARLGLGVVGFTGGFICCLTGLALVFGVAAALAVGGLVVLMIGGGAFVNAWEDEDA